MEVERPVGRSRSPGVERRYHQAFMFGSRSGQGPGTGQERSGLGHPFGGLKEEIQRSGIGLEQGAVRIGLGRREQRTGVLAVAQNFDAEAVDGLDSGGKRRRNRKAEAVAPGRHRLSSFSSRRGNGQAAGAPAGRTRRSARIPADAIQTPQASAKSSPPSKLPSVFITCTPSGVNRWKKTAPLITASAISAPAPGTAPGQ